MTRYFLDTSVLVSAMLSSKGHAADLIVAGARQDVILIVSSKLLLVRSGSGLLRNFVQAQTPSKVYTKQADHLITSPATCKQGVIDS